MKVPLFDLRPQQALLRERLRAVCDGFIDEPRFILGEAVSGFEQRVAAWLGVRHAVGVGSGSDALLCSLLALGIGPGDEVITTPFSFVSTAEAIARAGASVRFVDVQPGTLNLDPQQVPAAVTPRTRAVLAVHLYGTPADLPQLAAVCDAHGLKLIEDAAQALGARVAGKPIAGWGTCGALSFFPTKPLGGWGDGGMVVTNDAELAERCRALRLHGRDASGEITRVGGNFRLDALQAALLQVKLEQLDSWQAERAQAAARYDAALRDLEGASALKIPDGFASAHALYTIRVQAGRRDAWRAALAERGIETGVYYPRPLHLEPAYRGGSPGRLAVAEHAAAQVLSLPLYVGLEQAQQRQVIDALYEVGAH